MTETHGTNGTTRDCVPTDADFLAKLHAMLRENWPHLLTAMQRLKAGEPEYDLLVQFYISIGRGSYEAHRMARVATSEQPNAKPHFRVIQGGSKGQ